MRELAIEVLGEVPDQFVDYMVMKANNDPKIWKPKSEALSDGRSVSALSKKRQDSREDEEIKEDKIKLPVDKTRPRRAGTIDKIGTQPPLATSIQDRLNRNQKRIHGKELKLMNIASNAPSHKTMNVRTQSPNTNNRKAKQSDIQ